MTILTGIESKKISQLHYLEKITSVRIMLFISIKRTDYLPITHPRAKFSTGTISLLLFSKL